jgi:DNA-binding transcriptional LysR family regulator
MDLNAVSIFTQVVDLGSFTGAASALNMTKSTISRKVAELEQHLGVRLITRSTRSLVLTPEGKRLYQSGIQMLDMMTLAELEVSSSQELIKGPLHVVLPVELGQRLLETSIAEFLHKYPDVTLKLELSNREVDIIAEGIDICAQVGDLKDSNLVSRYLTGSKRLLVASPEYLHKFGAIDTHLDLTPPHQFIEHYNESARLPKWLFQQGSVPTSLDVPYRLRVNTITACRIACINGLGVTVLPEYFCHEHIQSGELIQLLPEYETPEISVNLVYTERQLMPKRKKAFIEHLVKAFEQRRS